MSDDVLAAELPPVLRIDEVAAFLQVSRSTAYELARSGAIPAVRIGRSLRVPRHRLLALLEGGEPDE